MGQVQQAALPAYVKAPKAVDRLFFALRPDATALSRITTCAAQLKLEHGLVGSLLREERFHVMLHPLGDHVGLPAQLIQEAGAAATSLVAPRFDVTFDQAQSFGRIGNAPVVLAGGQGLEPLKLFQRQLAAALQARGFAGWAGGHFLPHMTLLYDEVLIAPRSIEPITWIASEFVLVHSLIGKSRHTVLARFPLHG